MNSVLIAAICSSAAMNYNNACSNALLAGSIQSGADKKIGSIEQNIINRAMVYTPNQTVMTYMGLVYKIGTSQKIGYEFKNVVAVDKLSINLGLTSWSMGLQWRL